MGVADDAGRGTSFIYRRVLLGPSILASPSTERQASSWVRLSFPSIVAMQLISVGLLAIGFLIAAGSPALAQARATGADIRGHVQDSSGGRLAGSGVSARHRATNITRAVVADQDGRFVIPALEPGAYDVRAELDGFSPSVREGLVLRVGEVVDLSFSLEIAPVEQTVRVEAGATAVNPTQTAIATIIGRHEIDDLPLNGRRFIELAALSAGVTTGGPVDPAAETSGLSVLGQRPVSNNLMVDGFDNNDRILGGPSANFSQESVAEFQVLVGSYPAEFGNATGGIVNIVTRSGSNVPGGTAFLYGRDTALNARGHFEKVDPFGNPIDSPKATFEQWQFGGSFGAPLQRDRTFLFVAFEKTPTSASNIVTIDGTAAAVLTAGGFPVETGLVPYEQDRAELVARGDHYWKPAHSLSLRLHVADAMNGNYVPFGGLVARSRGARADRLDWGLAASQNDVIGHRWVNEARIQVARQTFQALPLDPVGPAVTLLGVASVGRSEFHPTERRNWSVQLKDTLTLVGARHTAKLGIDATTIDQQALLSYDFGGAYTFAELPPIPGLLPQGLSALGAFAAGLPALYVQGYGSGDSPFGYGELSLFAQDDWRVSSRLTLKGGLRYQHQRFPDEDITVSSLAGSTLTYAFPLGGHHVSPRVAAVFDLDGRGRTTLRAASGLFYGAQLTSLYGTTNVFGRDDGTRLLVYPFPISLAGWGAPGHVLPEGVVPLPRVTITIAPEARTPSVYEVSGGVTHMVGASTTLSADVVYSHGRNQLGVLEYNPLVAALGPGRRPNDIAGIAGTSTNVSHFADFGETWYRGLLLSATRRFGASGDARVSYTWSSAEDNVSRFAGQVDDNGLGRNPADLLGLPLAFDPDREKGPADTDQPHRLVVSGTWRGPWHLTLSGIVSAASGIPFTPLAGADLNGDGLPTSDRARSNPASSSSAVRRNSERLPAHVTADMRLARPIRISNRVTVTPMLEVFNLFNRTNFSEVNNIFGTGAFPSEPQRDANGRVTYGLFQKALPPRQVQLAARVAF